MKAELRVLHLRDVLEVAELDGLVGQKAQVPSGPALWGFRTSKGSDLCLSSAVDFGRAARARFVENPSQGLLAKPVAPGGDALGADTQEAGNGRKRLALVEQKQSAGPSEDSGWKRAGGREVLEILALEVVQLKVW
jgi:hypothetical protein